MPTIVVKKSKNSGPAENVFGAPVSENDIAAVEKRVATEVPKAMEDLLKKVEKKVEKDTKEAEREALKAMKEEDKESRKVEKLPFTCPLSANENRRDSAVSIVSWALASNVWL